MVLDFRKPFEGQMYSPAAQQGLLGPPEFLHPL